MHPDIPIYPLGMIDSDNIYVGGTGDLVEVENGNSLKIQGSCLIEVVGDVVITDRIVINTSENIWFIGDNLMVISKDSRQPAIGSETRDNLSNGRWSKNEIDLHLTFTLNSLVAVSEIDNFSIGCYGCLTNWDNVSLTSCMNVIAPDFVDNNPSIPIAEMVNLPDADPSSTKMCAPAQYLNSEAVKELRERKCNALKASNSFAPDVAAELLVNNSILVKLIANQDSAGVLQMIDTFTKVKEIGNFVKVVCAILDRNRIKKQGLGDDDFCRSIFKGLLNKEIWLFNEEHKKIPACPISIRAYCGVCDNNWALFEYRRSDNISFGSFMSELNLTKEMHDLYFPGDF